MELKRTVQCAKCPFKQSTNPLEIPNGYEVGKHKHLESCISKQPLQQTNFMLCHHSKESEGTIETVELCAGWLHNQLGTGNNLYLRVIMKDCENINELKVIGEQHKTFNDTIPK